MAYQTKQRDPLLDSAMQAAIEKRGRELIGLALLATGVAAALMLASYAPDDASFFSSSGEPAQNLLGRLGASIAAPLFIVVGFGAWAIPALLLVWGLRTATNKGADRAMGRVMYAPFAIAAASVYASTLVPNSDWTHSFGLGGLFGDTVLGAILNILPVQAAAGLRLVALPIGAGTVAMVLLASGTTKGEVRAFLRFTLYGVVMAYDTVVRTLGWGAAGTAAAAQSLAQARAARREERALARRSAEEEMLIEGEDEEEDFAPRPLRVPDEPPVTRSQPAPRAPRQGLLSSVSTLVRRAPEPAPPEADLPEEGEVGALDGPPSDDRIRARISDAIRARARTGRHISPQPVGRVEPPLRRLRKPDPLVLKVPGAVPAAPMAELDALPEEPSPYMPPPSLAEAGQTGGAARGPVSPSRSDLAGPVDSGAQGHDRAQDDSDWSEDEPHELHEADAFDAGAWADPALVAEDEAEDEAEVEDMYNVFAQSGAAAPSQAGPQVAPRIHPMGQPAPRAREPRAVVQHPPRKQTTPSRQAQAEAQPSLAFESADEASYEVPPLSLLTHPNSVTRHVLPDEALEENARMLENVLDDYGVKGEIVSVRPGPVVTMYELEPAPGLKASRVIGLADDIARSMSALAARVSTVPGRSVIGIELPNVNREKVVLREILSAREYGDSSAKLPLALGKDIGGAPVVANLAKMPHLLIAGTTGSGKSVAINTMILSLLYRLSPEECRLIMIDPKMLELSVYDGIPHLLSPVVTDPKKAVVALKWVVAEMEDRYRKMSKMGVRNIEGYNGRVRDALAKAEMFSRTVQTGFDDDTGEPVFETEEFAPEALPYIVVIVDEMADLMMVAGKEIEACIQRLAQMARASGIHLIMATQRPSVDVITGTIKANFPTRISFQVTSKVDSRTILGEMGAEQLLGMGDMLYMAGGGKITRVHGPFVSDEEVEEIVTHLKAYGPPDYVGGVVDGPDEERESDIDAVLGLSTGGNTDGEDALYDQAVAIVIRDRKCSTSYIQRKLGIGYNKAARLVEQMEEEGVVSASNHVGKREVLVPEA